MTRKLSKEEIKDKFDGEELDLSLCNLAKVPVREMVSSFGFRSKIIEHRKKAEKGQKVARKFATKLRLHKNSLLTGTNELILLWIRFLKNFTGDYRRAKYSLKVISSW